VCPRPPTLRQIWHFPTRSRPVPVSVKDMSIGFHAPTAGCFCAVRERRA